MANIHHKSSPHDTDPAGLAAAVETFLAACRRPAVVEDGEEPLELTAGNYTLELRSGRLWLESWSDTRTLARRLVAIAEAKPGLLRCLVHRFANTPARLTLLDLERPAAAQRSLAARRHSFAERFRRMLSRQFPGWTIDHVSSSLDLQRSFSSVYPRARLTRGLHIQAAVACPKLSDESGCLTAALLWFEHLRSALPPDGRLSLALFLPQGAGCLTAQRLKWLTGQSLPCQLFLFNEHGAAGAVDPDDLGNLETRVANPSQHSSHTALTLTGHLEIELEAAVRRHLELIDPTLHPSPVHSQVLTFVAGDRTIIDLLAVDRAGRLCIIELKASADLQLPLQALDYWMRIRWHAAHGELQHLFPTTPLSAAPPRLLLLAPATAFHSTNAAILGFFSPHIQVERIGVNSDWNRRLTVVMRLVGASAPISHENERHVDPRPHQHP